jgi:glycosyltransferase involved in cell wall biosynthesis
LRVLCLIDYLAPGGAQRQLCTLAVLLKRLGMDVSMLTYHPHDFFLPTLQAAGIKHTCLESRSIAGRILTLRRALRSGNQDVVLAFMQRPNVYAELAAIPRRDWGLVVSERVAHPEDHKGWRRWVRQLHRLADYVVTNSHTNRLIIERSTGRLASRLVTIYNVVDLELFAYAPPPPSGDDRPLRIAVAASFRARKNPARFVHAIALAQQRLPNVQFQLDWYGNFHEKQSEYDATLQCIDQFGLRDSVRLHPPSRAIADVYRGADVVALPSFFEGLPNVVCEAMACGRPILMSNVCDAGNLVASGRNGFLFDPSSTEDMARALVEFAAQSPRQREVMGRSSREMAERMFDPMTVAARYAEILRAAAARKRICVEHWVPEVPQSAHQFVT